MAKNPNATNETPEISTQPATSKAQAFRNAFKAKTLSDTRAILPEGVWQGIFNRFESGNKDDKSTVSWGVIKYDPAKPDKQGVGNIWARTSMSASITDPEAIKDMPKRDNGYSLRDDGVFFGQDQLFMGDTETDEGTVELYGINFFAQGMESFTAVLAAIAPDLFERDTVTRLLSPKDAFFDLIYVDPSDLDDDDEETPLAIKAARKQLQAIVDTYGGQAELKVQVEHAKSGQKGSETKFARIRKVTKG